MTVPKTWTQPEPPPEPGMDVVRVRKASASTTFKSKYRRAMVGAAGVAAELFIAALAFYLWLEIGRAHV